MHISNGCSIEFISARTADFSIWYIAKIVDTPD